MLRFALLAVVTFVTLLGLSCHGCHPASGPDAASSEAGAEAGTVTTAIVLNSTATSTTVYASFGADSAVTAADWPFCGEGSGCSFPLPPGATQLLPRPGGAYLNVTLSFDTQSGPMGLRRRRRSGEKTSRGERAPTTDGGRGS
jgi:hypothetical protein